MYNNSALQTGNSFQVIGAHLNGVQIKGPAEANGFNVDTSLIPLPCGGHEWLIVARRLIVARHVRVGGGATHVRMKRRWVAGATTTTGCWSTPAR